MTAATATFGDIESSLMHQTIKAAEDICKSLGLSFRIARRQGLPAVITRDHKPTRMNVGVCKDGFVTEVLGRG